MTEDAEALKRLQLATRLHGALMPLIERMISPLDGKVSIRDLHYMCSVAERIERAVDDGPNDELFLQLLSVLMQRTSDIRSYVGSARIAVDVADLSQAELDAVADSEIPEDLRWNSDEETAAFIVRGTDGYDYIGGTTHAVDFIAADIVIGLSLEQLAAQYPGLPAGAIEAVQRWNFERTGDDLSTTFAGRELAEIEGDGE